MLWKIFIKNMDIIKKPSIYCKRRCRRCRRNKEMMTNMRNTTVEKIGDYKVLTFKDVERDYVKDMVTGKESKTGLPKSNVLYYALEDDSWCCVRPSGTEPK